MRLSYNIEHSNWKDVDVLNQTLVEVRVVLNHDLFGGAEQPTGFDTDVFEYRTGSLRDAIRRQD